MSKTWPLAKLSDVLTQIEDLIFIEDRRVYNQVTVRMHNRGLGLRQECTGKDIKTKKQFRVREGQFVYSRIDARNGAMGLVPSQLDGAIVSNDFPVFAINCQLIDPQFFNYYISTETFISECLAKSKGTSNRRRLKEEDFLLIGIPLPTLDDQWRIVEKIKSMVDRVEEIRNLQQNTILEMKALIRNVRGNLLGEESKDDWIPLSYYVAEIENGRSPQCETRPARPDEWGVLKVGAVSFGIFDETANKALPAHLVPQPRYEVKPGDFLMIRANTRELVGACTMVRKLREHLLLSDKVFRFHFREGVELDLGYLNEVLKSPALRIQIEKQATGTSPTMKNISKAKVLDLLIPNHKIQEQRKIIKDIKNLQYRLFLLQELQIKSLGEVEVLIPSILYKAFNGLL